MVDSGFCQQGIGSELVGAAKRWAVAHKMPLRVRCNTSRPEAQKFYESLGLTTKNQQKVFES